MSQANLVISPTVDTGTTLSEKLNAWREALYSMQRGATRPAYAIAGFQWIDEVSASEWVWYMYDGTQDIQIATFNPTDHTITFQISILSLATLQAESVAGVEIRSANNTLVGTFGIDNNPDFYCQGNVTAYSDETLKKNWRELTPDFLNKLAQVKSGVYDRTDVELTQAGVSAQQLKEVLPEAVLQDLDGKLSVAYGNAALVAAIQLAREVVELKKQIAELRG
jgi:hypothetical protein